jgi:hypothetical protein
LWPYSGLLQADKLPVDGLAAPGAASLPPPNTLRFELGLTRYNLAAMRHYWLLAIAFIGLITAAQDQPATHTVNWAGQQ